MLRFTSAGAVATPTTVQIRAEQAHAGQTRVGAPSPSRGLSAEELRRNLEWVSAGLRGPRARPCTRLVLSGAGLLGRPDLPAQLQLARGLGFERIVVHVAPADLALLDRLEGRADLLVLPLRGGIQEEAQRAGLTLALASGRPVVANLNLTAAALPALSTMAGWLRSLPLAGLTLTCPFPGGAEPAPPMSQLLPALAQALEILQGAQAPLQVKGIPACHLGRHAGLARKTANRWYVDAGHQAGEALLFFPDVVAFYKEDRCRYCLADRSCDGGFSEWLRRADCPPLSPFSAPPAPAR